MAEAVETERLKMKDLLAITGLSKQTIHFYLREGLLPEPEKPKQNVAYYTNEHVIRINAIRRLQRDRSLTLSEIKKLLDDFDHDAMSFTDDLGSFEMALHAKLDGDLPSHDRSVTAVAASVGMSEDEIQELNRIGAIQIKDVEGVPSLDFRDVGILNCWARLMGAGYAGRDAFGEEFIRPYVEAMRPIAKYAVDSFFHEFGDSPTDEAAELAAQGTAITNELLVRLHTQELMRATRARVAAQAVNQPKK